MLENIILVAAILLILGGAAIYVIKAKKSGSHCIGCPHSKQCSSKTCGCTCGCTDNEVNVNKLKEE